MIKDYESCLRRQYISRNEDLNNKKIEVRRLAWLNFGNGEVADLEGKLELIHHPETVFIRFNITHHPDSVFIRFNIDTKEKPGMVLFYNNNYNKFY